MSEPHNELTQRTMQVESLRTQLAEMTIERNDLDDTRQGLEAEASYARQQLAEAKATIAWHDTRDLAQEEERDQLQATVEAAQATIAELESLNAGLRHAISVFTRNWDAITRGKEQLKARITALEDLRGQQRINAMNDMDALIKLKQQLARARAALETAREMIESEYCSHELLHGDDTPSCYSQFIYQALREMGAQP